MKPLSLSLIILTSALVARAGCVAPYFQQTTLTDRVVLSVVTVDLDGDGKADVAGITASGAFVLRNDGSGGFPLLVDVYSGALGGTLVAGDFNGDGRPDLAFARDGALVVLPGKGDGTFAAPIESAIAIKPIAIAAAHFHASGVLDLAAVDPGGKLSIFRNDGAGKFTELQRVAIRTTATVIAAGDLDADGKTDVVVAYENRDNLDAFYGLSGGTVDVAVIVSPVPYTTALQIADMDGNGVPDIAVATSVGTVGVIRNLGARHFSDPLLDPVYMRDSLTALAVADVTGDGQPDVVTAATCGIRTSASAGEGTLGFEFFLERPSCFGNKLQGSIATADFDGDGRIDVVAATGGGVTAYRNLCGDDIVIMTVLAPTISLGQTVPISVGVWPASDQHFIITATGTMSILEDDRVLATTPLRQTGASFDVAGLPLGDHTLVAEFSGDQEYNAGRSAPVVVHVTTATTTTTLTADPPSGLYGVVPLLTATVTSSTGDSPTGPIRFITDGLTVNTTTPTKAATATAAGPWSVGDHTIAAEFRGDATHPPSRATMTYRVVKQVPTLEAIPTFAVAGEADKDFVLAVHNAGTRMWPVGNLTLRIGDTVGGTRSTKEYPSQHFTLPGLADGRYMFRVAFTGDANYYAFDAPVPFVVFANAPPSIDARGNGKRITVNWQGAHHLAVQRTTPGQPWQTITCCIFPPFADETRLSPEVVYLYRSQSSDQTSYSNVDVGMLFSFTNDPLLPEQNVSALQVAEVVRAINILRAAASLSPFALPAVTPPAVRHRVAGSSSGFPASDVTLLRAAINEARTKLGAYSFDFTAPVVPNSAINATQLQELREAVR